MDKKKSQIRHFSLAFKKEKVELIESGKLTVLELSKIYKVSRRSIYFWLDKYGKLPKTERVVIEKKSEGAKMMEFLNRIKDLEAALGRKDLENSYLRLVIEKANAHFKCDIKKKLC